MAIVTGTRTASCCFLLLQLPEDICGGIVDGDQTCVGFVKQMPACCFFPSKQYAQTASQLACSRSSNIQRNLYTFLKFLRDCLICLQERYYNTAVNLMHCIAHIHQVVAEMRDPPERVEEQMCSCFFAL